MRINLKQAAIAAAVFSLLMPAGAAGQAVYCTNCGSEVTQVLNYIQLGEQLLKQAAQLEQSIAQTKIAMANATPLQQQLQGNAAADLKALQALVAQAQSLSFAAGNLDNQFATKFKDYQGSLGGTLDQPTFAAKYQQWSADTKDSVLITLKGAGVQATSIQGSEEALIQALAAQSGSAVGQLEAMQTGNAIATESIRQIQKLRQLVMLDLQLKANAIQTGQDRETSQQAAWTKFVTAPKAASTKGARF